MKINKILLMSVILIYGSMQSSDKINITDKKFELWNKSDKPFYYAVTQLDANPNFKNIKLLKPKSRAYENIDIKLKTKLLLSESAEATKKHIIYSFAPNKTIYVRIREGGKEFGPQTGPLLGFKNATESGLPLANNIKSTEITAQAFGDSDIKLVEPSTITKKAKDVTQEVQNLSEQLLKDYYLKKFPKSIESFSIKEGNVIDDQEQTFVNERLEKVKKAVEQFIGSAITNDNTPRIAICCSGGGYRAMLATLGFLSGLSESKLLDTITYASTLSGSTWALSGLLTSKKSIIDYVEYLKTKINNSIDTKVDIASLFQNLLIKFTFNQPLSLIDIFGQLVAQKVLVNSDLRVWDLQSYITPSRTPFAIFTAVQTDMKHTENRQYEWLEFSKYSVSSNYLNSSLAISSFGRKFNDGKTIDSGPSQLLSFLMGIWGSAISVNAKEIYNKLIKGNEKEIIAKLLKDQNLPQEVKNIIITTGDSLIKEINGAISKDVLCLSQNTKEAIAMVCEARIFPAQVYNWSIGLKKSPLPTDRTLTLVDAGIDFNLPVPALLKKERAIDIIIILDAGSDAASAKDLKAAQDFAKNNNLKFPKIDFTKTNSICSVHTSEDIDTPTVIYFPLIKNENYKDGWDLVAAPFTGTQNFAYTPEQIDLLVGLAKYNMITNKQKIIDTIKNVIATKSKS